MRWGRRGGAAFGPHFPAGLEAAVPAGLFGGPRARVAVAGAGGLGPGAHPSSHGPPGSRIEVLLSVRSEQLSQGLGHPILGLKAIGSGV